MQQSMCLHANSRWEEWIIQVCWNSPSLPLCYWLSSINPKNTKAYCHFLWNGIGVVRGNYGEIMPSISFLAVGALSSFVYVSHALFSKALNISSVLSWELELPHSTVREMCLLPKNSELHTSTANLTIIINLVVVESNVHKGSVHG